MHSAALLLRHQLGLQLQRLSPSHQWNMTVLVTHRFLVFHQPVFFSLQTHTVQQAEGKTTSCKACIGGLRHQKLSPLCLQLHTPSRRKARALYHLASIPDRSHLLQLQHLIRQQPRVTSRSYF